MHLAFDISSFSLSKYFSKKPFSGFLEDIQVLGMFKFSNGLLRKRKVRLHLHETLQKSDFHVPTLKSLNVVCRDKSGEKASTEHEFSADSKAETQRMDW